MTRPFLPRESGSSPLGLLRVHPAADQRGRGLDLLDDVVWPHEPGGPTDERRVPNLLEENRELELLLRGRLRARVGEAEAPDAAHRGDDEAGDAPLVGRDALG